MLHLGHSVRLLSGWVIVTSCVTSSAAMALNHSDNTNVTLAVTAQTAGVMTSDNTSSPTDGSDDYSDVTDDVNQVRARMVYLTFFPALLVLGTVGNVLAMVVMMRKKNRKHAISWYIAILSFSDTLFLYSNIPWTIVYEYTYQTVDFSVLMRCTVDYFTYYFSFEFSAWILVLMSMERFISLVYPIKAKVLVTPLRAKQICLALALILAAINVYHLTNHTVLYWEGMPYCGIRPGHAYVMNYVWPIVDAVIYSYLPSALMFALNGAIVYHMWQAKKQSLPHQASGTMGKWFPKMTRMLLAVSIVFICTTLPVETMFIVKSRSESYNALLYACLDVLMVLNHSINFYLYCFSTKRFRQELQALLCRNKIFPIPNTSVAPQQATTCNSTDTNQLETATS